MKIHIITVGTPKLVYAKAGWDEYLKRLQRYHQVRVSHIADKWAYDSTHLLQAAGNAYIVGLIIDGKQLTSPELATFLEQRALQGGEICFLIGGPEGLPIAVQERVHYAWSFSKLTFPHDLAMVVLVEAIYRASTINAGLPYHK